MKHALKLIPMLAVILMLGVAGCRSARTNTYESNERPRNVDPVLLKKIEPDRDVRKVAKVTNAIERISEGQPYLVQVEVTNTTKKPQLILYQWEWIDQNGITQQSTMRAGWLEKRIRGGEAVQLTGIAPNDNVSDFRLKLTLQ